jgi:hypothetical protein
MATCAELASDKALKEAERADLIVERDAAQAAINVATLARDTAIDAINAKNVEITAIQMLMYYQGCM